MKKLNRQAFNEIRNWVYRNARPLELAIWKYEFENGSKEEVLSALAFYQNEDGGFGQALEPDCWNPNSTPYTTHYAIGILKQIEFEDINHPILKGILRYLENAMNCEEGGWNFSIPSNNDYPHAPWWTYDRDANQYENVGLTLGISCFILKHTDMASQIYSQALSLVKDLIKKLNTQDNLGEMGIKEYCTLVTTLKQLGIAGQVDLELITNTVKQLVYKAIERDVTKWMYYGKRPSDFITSPSSEFYKDNEEILQTELDYEIDTRAEHGVWGITWSWFHLNDTYPKEFAITENWWKSEKAIEKLKLLRNFDRLEI